MNEVNECHNSVAFESTRGLFPMVIFFSEREQWKSDFDHDQSTFRPALRIPSEME